MKKIWTVLLSMGLLMSSSKIFSSDDLRLGEPGYGGTGCPAGTASVTLSPDQKSLSIIFDQYLLEAGGFSGKIMDRKSCNIAIPVHVPQGYSIAIVDVDYRGYNFLPQGAYSRFSAEYFFAGKRGPRFDRTFQGRLDSDYFISNTLGLQSLVWSACGADVNLRVNSSMMLRTNRQKDEAFSTVDSADVKAGIVYHVKWRRC